jgi:hypothetical protein
VTWARAWREGYELRLYEGEGPGIFTFTGWTKIPGAHTISTLHGRVLCYECEGLGVCWLCHGSVRHEGRRCPECFAGNHGPGNCTICGVQGCLRVDTMPGWVRTGYKGLGAEPVVEEFHATTNAEALAFAVRRPCAVCEEVRCTYRNEVVAAITHPAAAPRSGSAAVPTVRHPGGAARRRAAESRSQRGRRGEQARVHQGEQPGPCR